MTCCKCDEYRWNDPQKPVYIDSVSGLEFCIFHAPPLHKGVSVEEFNNIVGARINAANQSVKDGKIEGVCDVCGDGGYICNLSGTIFPDDIQISKMAIGKIQPKILFHNAVFHGDVDFSGVCFCCDVKFKRVKFLGNVNFRKTQFLSNADFYGVIFAEMRSELYFMNAIFLGVADFRSCEFCGKVDFGGSTFSDDSVFTDCCFRSKAGFDSVNFLGKVSFNRANLHNESRFNKSHFASTVNFQLTTFFNSAEFFEVAFSCGASFSDSDFTEDVTFFASRFEKGASFCKVNFENDAVFLDCKAPDQSLLMHELNKQTVQNIIFNSIQTPLLSFRGCHWPSRLALETHNPYEVQSLLRCEELYRSMKQRAASEHDQPMVSQWHFLEKLMQLKRLLNSRSSSDALDNLECREYSWSCLGLTRYIAYGVLLWFSLVLTLPKRSALSISWWYYNNSGFGERPIRAGLWLLCFTLAPIPVLSIFKAVETGFSFTVDHAKIPEVVAEWVRCMPLIRLDLINNEKFPLLASFRFGISWVFQVLIATQGALFAFAVRNKFRR